MPLSEAEKYQHALQVMPNRRDENLDAFHVSLGEGQDGSVADEHGCWQEHRAEYVACLLKVRLSAVSFSHG